jgi:hypothetical protein
MQPGKHQDYVGQASRRYQRRFSALSALSAMSAIPAIPAFLPPPPTQSVEIDNDDDKSAGDHPLPK